MSSESGTAARTLCGETSFSCVVVSGDPDATTHRHIIALLLPIVLLLLLLSVS